MRTAQTLVIAFLASLASASLHAQTAPIDTSRSTLEVHVSKSGIFSAFAHNHEIAAPITEGTVTMLPSSAVILRVDARKLRVLDADVSAEDRAKIQATMQGPMVLDAPRFPEITFESTSVRAAASSNGADHWTVRGNLTLHGQTHAATIDVTLKDAHYRGSAIISQRDFGIVPISLAGGSVKVKDVVQITFDIVLAP